MYVLNPPHKHTHTHTKSEKSLFYNNVIVNIIHIQPAAAVPHHKLFYWIKSDYVFIHLFDSRCAFTKWGRRGMVVVKKEQRVRCGVRLFVRRENILVYKSIFAAERKRKNGEIFIKRLRFVSLSPLWLSLLNCAMRAFIFKRALPHVCVCVCVKFFNANGMQRNRNK